jgi:hypothetical protein
MISGHQSARAERDTNNCDPRTDDMCFNGIPMEHAKVTSDSFDAHGNETLAYVPFNICPHAHTYHTQA